MDLKQKMEDALNDQVNAELYAGHIYLSMSAYCETLNLGGFGNWMREQAKEEYGHAMRIYKHIVERGGTVKLGQIDAPPVKWKNPLDAFKGAYDHEVKVTKMINDLVDLARKLDDKAAESFLKWFIDEQVEEEEQTDSIVAQLKMIGDSNIGLIMLDRALAKRGGD
ncbi:MAG: ferritin [Methanobacteriota archaeon]